MTKEQRMILEVFLAILLALILAKAIQGQPMTVAVLACKNNADRTYNDFVKGIPDMIMTGLSKCDKIDVVERVQIDNAMKSMAIEQQFIDFDRSLRIGKWLHADAVLLASFTVADQHFRLDARLINTDRGKQIVAEKVQGPISDMLACVDRLCKRLAVAVGGTFDDGSKLIPGTLLMELKVKQALFSDRDFYHQRCRIFVDGEFFSKSPVVSQINTPIVLVNKELPAGNHIVTVQHGYVDKKGNWIKPMALQPKAFLLNVQPAKVHKISYVYRLGSIRENFEYDENDKSFHGYVKKVL